MDVRQLGYFLAVAENGSLASAANVIGIAQPSLSLQIKNLEARLGTDLLVRTPRWRAADRCRRGVAAPCQTDPQGCR